MARLSMFVCMFQCLQHRALNPDAPLPELSPIVAAGLQVPTSVGEKAKTAVEQLRQKFVLEPVGKKETATGDKIFKAK